MALAISFAPTFPVAGQLITLGATGSVGNLLEFFVTAVPAGSQVTKGRIRNYGQTFVPDVPGVYQFGVSDWTRNYTSPRWNGDNVNTAALTLNATATSQQVVVSQILTRRLGVDPDTIDIVLIVQDSNIQAATFANAKTKAAEVAAQDFTVMLALNACVNRTVTAVTVSTLDDTLLTKATNLRTNYEAHRVLTAGSVHNAADATNVVTRNNTVNTDDGAIGLLNDIRFNLSQHMLSQVASGATKPHNNPDAKDVVRAPAASDKRTGHVLADNMWSVYEAHRVAQLAPGPGGLVVHTAADNTDVLNAQKPLAALQASFINTAYSASLAAPDGQQAATTILVTAHGFTA